MAFPASVDVAAPPARSTRSVALVAFLGLLSCAASLALYALPIARPLLLLDDFQIIFRSWTWPTAWSNLWVPANEHAMPLGRISTCTLATLAGGRPTAFLTLTGWHGPVALVVGMILVGLFVGRERQHPFYGLLAMTLFGVSTTYQGAISWFSASFSVVALDTLLVALLAAQHAVRTNTRWPLPLCFLGCALAPGWFAIGILAGPICGAYLLIAASERDSTGPSAWGGFQRPRGAELLRAIIPILGSFAFLAISLPMTANTIMHLPHYGEKTAIQSFQPMMGLLWTCRSLVDNLVWSLFGFSPRFPNPDKQGKLELPFPTPCVWVLFTLMVAFGYWWVRRAPRKTLVMLGIGVIVMSYWLVYSARVDWTYPSVVNWDRYHLLPQMGLAFAVAGGLPSLRQAAGFGVSNGLSQRQVCALLIVIGGLFVCQLPRGVLHHVMFSKKTEVTENEYTRRLPFGWSAYWVDADLYEDQRSAMRRIEEVDALCREHRIAAAVAQRVLPEIRIPPCDCVDEPRNESNWQFLHGSPDPQDISDDEARRILQPAAQERSDD